MSTSPHILPLPAVLPVRPTTAQASPVGAPVSDQFVGKSTLPYRDLPTVRLYQEQVRHIPESFVTPAQLEWVHAHLDDKKRIQAKPEELPIWNTQVHELVMPNGGTVRLRRYTNDGAPQGPAVLYLSGSDEIPYGGDPYLENGVKAPYQVFSLDRPYIQNGKVVLDTQAQMRKMKTALQYLYQMTGQKVHVVGFSLGGFLAANLAAQCPNEIKSLTMFSPSMPTPSTFKDYLGILRVEEKTPETVADLWNVTKNFPDTLRHIKVPTALYIEKAYPEDQLEAMNLIRQNIPEPIEEFQVFNGTYDGRHMVTLAKLNALSQWWQSFN